MRFPLLLAMAGLFCVAPVVQADMLTLCVASGTTNYTIGSNVCAKVVYQNLLGINGWVRFTVNAQTFGFNGNAVPTVLPTVAGPATITVTATNSIAVCTLDLTSATSFTPSTAVVVPNDNAGPVTIVLESSVDLVTWTAALPGTYGTTTTNRFFRVRAVR